MLYVLSDVLAFVLFKVLGYRRKVIFKNLQRAFPEKNEQEMLKLVRATYQNLTDVTLETLKSFTLSFAEIERRAICINPELVNHYLDQGKSVLLTGSHFGNWEYSGLSMPLKCLYFTISFRERENEGFMRSDFRRFARIHPKWLKWTLPEHTQASWKQIFCNNPNNGFGATNVGK